MTLTEAIKAHGLEWQRGRPIADGSRRLFIHDDDLNSAIALWEDEPEYAYRQRRFYGGETRNAPLCSWIYGSYPVLADAPLRQTATECAAAHNGHPDHATSLGFVTTNDEAFELRICGTGQNAFFEWINAGGDPIGDAFFEFDGLEYEKQRFSAIVSSPNGKEEHTYA